MRSLVHILAGAALLAAPFAWADNSSPVPAEPFDVYVLGEFHDNPTHHAVQATFLEQLSPRAVVYEMLTADEAAQLRDVPRDKETLLSAIDEFHWSNLADYIDLLTRSSVIVGAALPREDVRVAFADGAAAVFGEDAQTYGLTTPLPEDEAETRAQLQFEAHCEAMPMDMMGGMIEAQRLRDAAFARAVINAVDSHGQPVVLITGNGHARRDWGVPAYLARARPDLTVFALGQSESGSLSGAFDTVTDAPTVERSDPCAAFR